MPRRVALLATAVSLLIGDVAHGQARGPSQKEVAQKGSLVRNAEMRREQQRLEAGILANQQREREDRERLALLDPDYRTRKFADLQEFLGVMPGTYRIESRVEYQTYASAPVVQYNSDESGSVPVLVPGRRVPIMRSWAVAGSAQCMPVEMEADLLCRFEPGVLPVTDGSRRLSYLDATDNMRPAMMLFALEREQPALRSTLLADGQHAQEFTGTMEGGTISSKPNGPCARGVCFRTLEASTTDDAEHVTLVLKSMGMTMSLTMHRVSAPVRDNVLRPEGALLSPARDH